jgi:antitoxin (DNA-binding transcriptional repressor) of toxin-antitoxin stability system
MREVKVTDLRSNLPAYLAAVQGGEELRVVSRGQGHRPHRSGTG